MEEIRSQLLKDYAPKELLEINKDQFQAVFNFILEQRASRTEIRAFRLSATKAKAFGISFKKFKAAWPINWYINDQDASGVWVLIPDRYFHG